MGVDLDPMLGAFVGFEGGVEVAESSEVDGEAIGGDLGEGVAGRLGVFETGFGDGGEGEVDGGGEGGLGAAKGEGEGGGGAESGEGEPG